MCCAHRMLCALRIATTSRRFVMPRLFTGLEIPSVVAQSLAMMRGGLPGARWIDPENYHLTLRFIGDIDDALAGEIAGMLGRVQRGAVRAASRRAVVVRRPQAARGGRRGYAGPAAHGAAGGAGAADAAARAGARRPQIHASCHAGAAARYLEPRRSPTISPRAGIFAPRRSRCRASCCSHRAHPSAAVPILSRRTIRSPPR